MDEILKRDQNDVTVLGAITDDANQNIRMLRVDPATFRLLVSGTGGGGGGTGFQLPIAPNTTVDGTNLTFTWAVAPQAISVDGIIIQATQQDGGVNWTVPIGNPLQTDLTNAPNFSIFGVA